MSQIKLLIQTKLEAGSYRLLFQWLFFIIITNATYISSGLEIDDARNEEERKMIEDANSWVNQNKIDETLDWQGK